MKTCPKCQQTYPDDVESCPRDGSRLPAEVRDERECPYCAERILKKARVCKHCGREVEPLVGSDVSVQTPPAAPPKEWEITLAKMVDRANRQMAALKKAEDEQLKRDAEAAELAKRYDEWNENDWHPESDDPIPEEFKAIHDKDLKDWLKKLHDAANTPEARRESQQEDRNRAESEARDKKIAEWEAQHPQSGIFYDIALLWWSPFGMACRTIKTILLVLIMAAMLLIPLGYLTTRDPGLLMLTKMLWIPTLLFTVAFAPWYGILTILPMSIIADSFVNVYVGEYPNGFAYKDYHTMFLVIWIWSLYGLLRGISYEIRREIAFRAVGGWH